jgi:hypothetical protein
MDSKNFRKVSDPNLYASYKNINPKVTEFVLPNNIAPDNRYPKWAAMMDDGRLTTNYNNHCSQNVATGEQFPTKQFMQKNAEEIIFQSRKNQMPFTRSLDASVLPFPAQVLDCSKSKCKFTNTDSELGIGVERLNNNTPFLFGTFMEQSYEKKPYNNLLTHYYEGGRNTPTSKRVFDKDYRFIHNNNDLNSTSI